MATKIHYKGMSKIKTIYVCSNCGHKSPKWMGKCPSCNSWNTYQEEVESTGKKKNTATGISAIKSKPTRIQEVESLSYQRLSMKNSELNRILGGGLVPGSLILIGGDPGIGKSTLMLQESLFSNHNILYVSGEESSQQIKMRADRIGENNENLFLYNETTVEDILKEVEKVKPDYVVIDSIQTLRSIQIDSASGTVLQIRESTDMIRNYAKQQGISFFIIGHITKEGSIAGPKLLEHLVDVVLQFEGEKQHHYRLLRCLKNRFGSIDEIGVFEMYNKGLKTIENPSEIWVNQRDNNISGIAVAIILEGMRPFAIEVQALVSKAVYGTPQRTTTSYHIKRLQMLLAVLDKKCGYHFSSMDVYVNIAGGFKVEDTSVDLAVAVALISSYLDQPISSKFCFFGEVGLTGEVRSSRQPDIRHKEALQLGFENIIASGYNKLSHKTGIVKINYLNDLEKIIS